MSEPSSHHQLDFEDDDYDDSFENTDLIDQALLQPNIKAQTPHAAAAAHQSSSSSAAAAPSSQQSLPRLSTSSLNPAHLLNQYNASHSSAPWTLAFYQPYFNVTTRQVLQRILRAFMGPLKWDFFSVLKCESDTSDLELDVETPNESEASPSASQKSHADLWGPFWITFATALVLIIASNTIDLMNYANLDDAKETWTNDFTTVTLGIGVLYSYGFVMALLLWMFTKFLEVRLSLLDTMCLYGYSNAVAIPFYALCIAFSSIDLVRWFCVGVAFVWSALFLCVNTAMKLNTELRGTFRVYIAPIVGVMFAAHMCMGFFVKLYFLW